MNKLLARAVPVIAVAVFSVSSASRTHDPELPAPSNALKTVAPGEAAPLPAVQTAGEVEYVTGGIPHEQLPAFRQARRDYALNIEIFQREGGKSAFTADADVRVSDVKNGNVILETKAAGPYLWAKVPPGTYKVQATLKDRVKEARVTVKKSGPTRAVIVFPETSAK